METLDPIELIRCFVSEESIHEGSPLYEIEQEFQQWVILHAQFFLERYKAGLGKHWTENELETTRLGLCGQKAFELMLQKMQVAYVPNDPIIDQRLTKDYDFWIPKIGTIEIKTYLYYCRKVLVKPSEWHGNDYLIVWQFRDKNQLNLKMIGWLSQAEVEAHPTTKKGKTCFNPYSDAIIIDMTDLRSPEIFITKLQQVRRKI